MVQHIYPLVSHDSIPRRTSRVRSPTVTMSISLCTRYTLQLVAPVSRAATSRTNPTVRPPAPRSCIPIRDVEVVDHLVLPVTVVMQVKIRETCGSVAMMTISRMPPALPALMSVMRCIAPQWRRFCLTTTSDHVALIPTTPSSTTNTIALIVIDVLVLTPVRVLCIMQVDSLQPSYGVASRTPRPGAPALRVTNYSSTSNALHP